MSPFDTIVEMLRLAGSGGRKFPATIFYNEGWLLRLVLDWFSRINVDAHPLNFAPGAGWYSEALLPSQFLPRDRTDRLAEGWTQADGIIGHFFIGDKTLANTELKSDSSQFLVAEAKLFSRLSRGVTNASYFDQAARNVACIAEVLFKAKRKPEEFSSLGFFVLAPKEQIALNLFGDDLSKESIAKKVARRVSEYPSIDRGEKEQWLEDGFLPVLSCIKIHCLSWEALIDSIHTEDPGFGEALLGFYGDCLKFNRAQEVDQVPSAAR